ncbi:amidohydrolase family protein [Natrinema sp. 1APR25-10V2]|uniref:amidohydrolase family protein n=1 Tax=Natrinema sp. 1APR25-10V2 TaxID=2951081 RepID=UPI0028755409|nr:amidohydrolase family protein [Natrinema sp. 1APR25-10V2]MDS0474519.1 amidohydrolase [Natrinema sp. 1APR25-10V2]
MATERDVGSSLSDTTIVDTDVHIGYGGPVVEATAERMDEPWAGYVDPERTPDRYRYPSPGLPKPLGGRKEFLIEREKNGANTHPDFIREVLMDEIGVDYPICNFLSAVERAWKTERVIAEMRAQNEVLIEHFLEGNDDFYGLANITMRDPDAAVEEIERIGDHDQIVGVFIFTGTKHQKPPGDPQYDPVYRALADHDLTPTYHVTNFVSKAPFLQEYEKMFAWHPLAQSWSIQHTVVSLIAQGVPAKFPELDFVMLEGGVTWIPWAMARLNREHGQWRSEVPYLEKSPEEHLRDQFYFSTQPLEEFNDPKNMFKLLDIIGPESLVFSTDYPHYDFDDPGAIDRFFAEFTDEERDMVFGGNAIDAYGLDI